MDMARIGMRDNMVELFVVHKDGATTKKGCTIEEVEDIDAGEAAAPTADTVGPGPIVLHKAQSFAQAKVGKKPTMVKEAQNDMLEDDDEERSESDLEVAFDDSDDDWNGDGGLYDVELTTMKDSQKMKQSVPTGRVQGEFSGSVNKSKEKVVAAGLRDEDDGYESEELWDMKREDTWQLTSCYKKHRCSKATKIGIMSSQWLSKAFMKKICENPKIKLRTLIKKAHSKWNVDLTMTKAARVKQQVLDEINGTYGEQYKRIHDYAAELLRSNPGSTVQIQVERPPKFQLETPIPGKDMRPQFERIYICLDACKRSFMVCRPMIDLDGCFIKTPYRGQLLTAIGWDPYNKAAPQAKKGAGTTRTPNPSKIPAKTATQPATKLQPKRKSNTQVGGSQESQTSSKRPRCSSSTSQPQPSTATVTSPSRRTLKFMAKTPPRVWKALG
ncbi:hypothetical protein Ahy_A06g029614 [Arachis hypogaea]|uniref:Uncharacterized protein n=1 Tax=Arachis hypogaea TaxID=3818 RepID=A0A445CTZ1_ARAHY|nr:hypothetical protein Ahy_A06g029614 [Arachis hypogaea]